MMLSQQEERDHWKQALRDSISRSDKNWWITVVLSIFGIFGLDRFYVGRPFLGVAKLLTGGGIGAWWIADLALVFSEKMKDGDGRTVRKPPRKT